MLFSENKDVACQISQAYVRTSLSFHLRGTGIPEGVILPFCIVVPHPAPRLRRNLPSTHISSCLSLTLAVDVCLLLPIEARPTQRLSLLATASREVSVSQCLRDHHLKGTVVLYRRPLR